MVDMRLTRYQFTAEKAVEIAMSWVNKWPR